MTTRPIDQDYNRVISAKFSTDRKGQALTCRYCSHVVIVGRDHAAVDAAGKWHNVCTTCATSRAAQVAGLVTKVEALAASLTGPSLDALVALAGTVDADATAAIAGDEAAARRVLPMLFTLLDNTKAVAQVVATSADPFAAEVERLRHVLPFIAGKDATFAQSLVSQWDTRGRLSDKQKPYVTKLAAAGEAVEADQVLSPITTAILARVGGRPSVRVAITSGGHNDLDFLAVFVGRVERHIGAPGAVRVIPLAPSQALTLAQRILALDAVEFLAAQGLYGTAMQSCGRCGSPLTDLQSRTQGFGPDCITMVSL